MYRNPYPYNQQLILGLKPERVTKVFLIINGIVFLIELVTYRFWEHGFKFIFDHLALTPYRVVYKVEIWQIITYFWLHSPVDLGHIIWNMLTLWLFASFLEKQWGSRAFLKFYLYCGMGAGVTVLVTGLIFDPVTPTIGASGAILGLVAAFGILFPDLPIYIFGIFPIKGKTVALITVGINLLILLTGAPGISVAAHLGGMAIGAILVTGLWRPGQWKLWYYKWKLKRLSKERDSSSHPPYYH